MANWYCTLDDVRELLEREGDGRDAAIGMAIAAVSRDVDSLIGVRAGAFIPETAARSYRWPQNRASLHRDLSTLFLDEWLISLSALTSENQGNTIDFASDAFLEPGNYGPPYTKIEIDQAATAATARFGAATTPQRAILATGSWGLELNTIGAGNLNGAIADAVATSVAVTDGSKVAVGHTVLIDSEQMFVSAIDFVDIGQNGSGTMTAAKSDQTVTLGGAPTDAVVIGEILRRDSEQMRVTGITSATIFTVERAVNGSTLAAHSDADDVFVRRTLTVERGVNGTTAAAQSDDAAITRFVIPAQVREYVASVAASQEIRGGQGNTGGNQPFNTISNQPKASSVSLAAMRNALLQNPRFAPPPGAMFGLAG